MIFYLSFGCHPGCVFHFPCVSFHFHFQEFQAGIRPEKGMWVVGKMLNPMVGSWNSSYAVSHMNHMDLLFFIFREINVKINGIKIKYENKEKY